MFWNDFKVVNIDRDPVFQPSSLQGYISANFYDIVDRLGEPTHTSDDLDKMHTCWELAVEVSEEGEDDTEKVFVTLYDWKEDSADVARSATAYQWHIGGACNKSVDVLESILAEVK